MGDTTIASAASGLAAGATTASALAETSLGAIRAHNSATNAFVTVDEDAVRTAARAVDRERAAGVRRGPLHGIPISLKDLIDEAGVVTTAGSRVLSDRVAPCDATVVERLQAAGAVILGRTNLHEFAFGTTSEQSAFGPVRHPLDPTRSAGGSSGGSAVAVACGMGLGSLGTDTGGSVRIPAAACGVVGLKPSRADVPLDGVIPLSASLDHVGPLAKTVQDASWILAVLAGREPSTVRTAPANGLRLKRLGGYFARPLDDAVRPVFEEALGRLASSGMTLLEGVIIDADRIAETYLNIVLPEAAHWHAPYLDTRADRYTPAVAARLLQGRAVPAIHYLAARERAAALRDAVNGALDDCDALVLPTQPLVAPPLGADLVVIDRSSDAVPLRPAMLKHTQPFNLTGHPAISLPIAADGLPVGLQLVGPLGNTDRLLEVAAACERIVSVRGAAR